MMLTAEEGRERARSPLAEIVATLAAQTGSRMIAYERIAAKLGHSPTWVRKVIGRAPDVAVAIHDAINITTLHARLCARIEAAADAIEAENKSLREKLDVAEARARSASRRATGPCVPAPSAARGRPGSASARGVVAAPDGARPDATAAHVTDLPLWRASEEK